MVSLNPPAVWLTQFSVPTGPGLRTDTYGYLGYTTNPNYDSLLAKLICYSPSPDYQDAVIRAQRGLKDFAIGGVETNLPLLQAIVAGEVFQQNQFTTRYLDEHLTAFCDGIEHRGQAQRSGRSAGCAGVDPSDPLAVLGNFTARLGLLAMSVPRRMLNYCPNASAMVKLPLPLLCKAP